jgi:hypothetical protein
MAAVAFVTFVADAYLSRNQSVGHRAAHPAALRNELDRVPDIVVRDDFTRVAPDAFEQTAAGLALTIAMPEELIDADGRLCAE